MAASTLLSRGPKNGRIGYMTPTFSRVPNRRGHIQKGATSPLRSLGGGGGGAKIGTSGEWSKKDARHAPGPPSILILDTPLPDPIKPKSTPNHTGVETIWFQKENYSMVPLNVQQEDMSSCHAIAEVFLGKQHRSHEKIATIWPTLYFHIA